MHLFPLFHSFPPLYNQRVLVRVLHRIVPIIQLNLSQEISFHIEPGNLTCACSPDLARLYEVKGDAAVLGEFPRALADPDKRTEIFPLTVELKNISRLPVHQVHSSTRVFPEIIESGKVLNI